MAEELLPPDPSKDGWYWIQLNHMKFIWMWSPRQHDWWYNLWARISAQKAYEEGYRLASPHPIPTPEQLDALHALPDSLERQAETDIIDAGLSQDHFTHWRQSAGYSAARLRAALGAKP